MSSPLAAFFFWRKGKKKAVSKSQDLSEPQPQPSPYERTQTLGFHISYEEYQALTLQTPHPQAAEVSHPEQPAPHEPQEPQQRRERKSYGITASDIPQWRWKNEQCREWIAEVLIEYGGKDRGLAETLAMKFEGFSPIMYMSKWAFWTQAFGLDGQGIYAFLLEHKREVVPEDLRIELDS